RAELRAALGIEVSEKVLLFVANDVSNPRKGMKELMEAINTLKEDHLLICTVGNRMDEKTLNKKVKQFGFVKDEKKMAELYAMADIFILPSHAENFPNSIIESFLCGTPVIASKVGGIPEQVNEKNGILVEKGNAAELSAAIQDLLMKKEQMSGEEIRKAALTIYGTELIVKRHLEVYKDAIDRSSSAEKY
ncbi:MAG: glycosyltransferase, partial [Bacteroidia bacterium]